MTSAIYIGLLVSFLSLTPIFHFDAETQKSSPSTIGVGDFRTRVRTSASSPRNLLQVRFSASFFQPFNTSIVNVAGCLSIKTEQLAHNQMPLSIDDLCSAVNLPSYLGPCSAAAVIWAATPIVVALSFWSWLGPIVNRPHSGLEQI